MVKYFFYLIIGNEIEFSDELIAEKIFIYNHTLLDFQISGVYFEWKNISKIMKRNRKLHKFYFIDFKINFDLIFIFSK
jgi:hypothetical protein